MRSKVPLYLVTLLIETVFSLFRSIFLILNIGLVLSVLYLFFSAVNGNLDYLISRGWLWDELQDFVVGPSIIIGFLLGFFNIFTSINAVSGFGGGSMLTRFVLGAREPSTRERERIVQTVSEISSLSPGNPKGFSFMYIIDSPFDQVNLIGTTLYISSGAVQSESLLILLAHEIGHLNRGDGALILGLRRLVFPLFQIFIGGIRDFSTNSPNKKSAPKEFDAIEIYYFLINKILFLWLATLGGGIGTWLLSLPWAEYFRNCDYEADRFVASIGLKDQLIEYLEQGKFYDSSVPYMLGWQPVNELRIDRLQYPHKVQIAKYYNSEQTNETLERMGRDVRKLITSISNYMRSRVETRKHTERLFGELQSYNQVNSAIHKGKAAQAPPIKHAPQVQARENKQQQSYNLNPKLDYLVRELSGNNYDLLASQFAEVDPQTAIKSLTNQLATKRGVSIEEIEKLLEEQKY